MTSQRFSRECHLRSGSQFARVYNRRCKASDAMLLVYACENERPFTRLGLSVSRKVGGAVVRNRWKRLLREAFRLSRVELPIGVDLVVIPQRGVEPSLCPLMKSLVRLSGRAATRLQRA